MKKQIVQKREFFSLEKARLEKYQIENYDNALTNRQPRPPISLKIQVDEVVLHETSNPRERNVVEIKMTVEGPEKHIESWQADVAKMLVKTTGDHGSHSVGERYKNRNKKESGSESSVPGTQ